MHNVSAVNVLLLITERKAIIVHIWNVYYSIFKRNNIFLVNVGIHHFVDIWRRIL